MPLIGTRWNPKGPSTKHMKEHLFFLSGVEIQIKAPLSNNIVSPGRELDAPLNIYDRSTYVDKSEEKPGAVLEYYLLGRNWYFAGLPIIDGANFGIISMGFTVSYMPEFASLFRPRRFECAIERYISSSSCLYPTSGHSRVEYARQMINGVDWGNHVCHIEEDESSAFQTVWHTPVSDDHLLTIEFTQSACAKGSGLMRAYAKLMKTIMDSVTIKLPQDIQSLKTEVQKAYPYESFPTFMPPYVFEQFEPRDESDVIRKVSFDNGHDFSIPDHIFDKEVEDIIAAENKKQVDVHQQVLKSHLRFEELEAEDHQCYLAEQKVKKVSDLNVAS